MSSLLSSLSGATIPFCWWLWTFIVEWLCLDVHFEIIGYNPNTHGQQLDTKGGVHIQVCESKAQSKNNIGPQFCVIALSFDDATEN